MKLSFSAALIGSCFLLCASCGSDSGSSSDSNTGGGGSAGSSSAPPGVSCSEHPPCTVDQEAASDDCVAPLECKIIAGCPEPLCITHEQACEETCPPEGGCGQQTSYPPRILCELPGAPGRP